MAIVPVTVQSLVPDSSITPTYQGSLSASDTYTFPANEKTIVHAKKSGAGACNLTLVTPRTIRGLAIADLVVVVPATTGDKMIGPLTLEDFVDPATGLVTMSFSEITGLTVGVFRML